MLKKKKGGKRGVGSGPQKDRGMGGSVPHPTDEYPRVNVTVEEKKVNKGDLVGDVSSGGAGKKRCGQKKALPT